mgnify:CR=1 FL=1
MSWLEPELKQALVWDSLRLWKCDFNTIERLACGEVRLKLSKKDRRNKKSLRRNYNLRWMRILEAQILIHIFITIINHGQDLDLLIAIPSFDIFGGLGNVTFSASFSLFLLDIPSFTTPDLSYAAELTLTLCNPALSRIFQPLRLGLCKHLFQKRWGLLWRITPVRVANM